MESLITGTGGTSVVGVGKSGVGSIARAFEEGVSDGVGVGTFNGENSEDEDVLGSVETPMRTKDDRCTRRRVKRPMDGPERLGRLPSICHWMRPPY